MAMRKARRAQRVSTATFVAFLILLAARGSMLATRGRPLAAQSNLPRPEEVVKASVYVSRAPVPRGQAFEVAVLGEIKPGFHINGNKPLEEYLIATTVEPQLPAGFKLVNASYPKAKLQKFPFSDNKLAVYDGTFVVRLKLEAAPGAPLGKTKLPMTLRYQACNDELCLPPAKLPLEAQFEVAPTGAKSNAQHAEIFRKR
jgi:hypothetical protein